MANDMAKLWAAIQQVKADTARQDDIDTVVAAASDPILWTHVQDFCADLRGENIHATGVEGSSIQDIRNAVKPVLRASGLLLAIPKTKVVQASPASILELAWQTMFRGLAPMSASLQETYQAGASLYASIDSYFDPRTGGIIKSEPAAWWKDGTIMLAGIPANVWNDARLSVMVASMGQHIGRMKGEEIDPRNHAVAGTLHTLIESLEAIYDQLCEHLTDMGKQGASQQQQPTQQQGIAQQQQPTGPLTQRWPIQEKKRGRDDEEKVAPVEPSERPTKKVKKGKKAASQATLDDFFKQL